MTRWVKSVLNRYGAAVLIIFVATLARLWLDAILDRSGFAVFVAAVVIASWYGGLGPSLLALALSLVVSAWLFSAPPGSTPEHPFSVFTGLGIFFFIGIATALLSESMRAARRRAEGEREQLRTTLACIGDAVIVTDERGRITMMNAVAESLTGWRTLEAAGRPLEDVFCVRNEFTGVIVQSPVARVLAEGAIVGLANHTMLIAKDGSRLPIDDSAAPIRNVLGQLTGVVLIFRDVSERRRSEQALREADQRKDEFLATLSHELRNPLSPIQNAVQLLKRKEADADARWCQEVIERQVQQLTRLIDDLLDISRITRDRLELRKEPVELQAVVRAAVESCQGAMAERKHRLTVQVPSEPLVLHADFVRLVQIVLNLLDNAAKYTEPGGKIGLHADREGDEVVLRVRDNGKGVPAEKLDQLFQMFFQIDRSGDGGRGGLGIGLSLVRRLTEMHGGTVWATSGGLGQGSEFVVRLPVAAGETTPTKAPARNGEMLPRQKRRVLVVDDNRDAADSLKMILEALGQEVYTAYDGQEGIERAASIRPDLVFLDIGMPKLNGYDAARLMRQQAWGSAARLVALTGWGQEEDRRRSQEAGFDLHLVKPVEFASLQTILQGADGEASTAAESPTP